ncbi:MAG: hypothetical protein H6742_10305 [Alphaproteobacteria bacterium]|nr:hypothetical protein [Alphaproteobacteria bacterium]
MDAFASAIAAVPAWLWAALSAVSLVLAVASLAVMPRLLIALPDDWLLQPRPGLAGRLAAAPPRARIGVLARNAAGGLLVVLGILMLFVPGQGVLTILAGLVLVDLPGRMRVARWLLAKGRVARAVDRLRGRAGVAPLQRPPEQGRGEASPEGR